MTGVRTVELQPRDMELILYLSQNGCATGSQLTSAFFPSRGAFLKRVSLLKSGGLICSESVSRQAIGEKTTLYYLGKRLSGRDNVPQQILKHQLGLNDVYLLLKSKFPNAQVLNELELISRCYSWEKDKKLPDLLMTQDQVELAVEYERSIKRNDWRYYSKWFSYKQSRLTHVLYVMERKEDIARLAKLAQNFHFIAFCWKFEMNKVFTNVFGFESLEDFLSRFMKIKADDHD